MIIIYSLLIVGAPGMVLFVLNAQGSIPPKTWIQAGIMFLVGVGGLYTLTHPTELESS